MHQSLASLNSNGEYAWAYSPIPRVPPNSQQTMFMKFPLKATIILPLKVSDLSANFSVRLFTAQRFKLPKRLNKMRMHSLPLYSMTLTKQNSNNKRHNLPLHRSSQHSTSHPNHLRNANSKKCYQCAYVLLPKTANHEP